MHEYKSIDLFAGIGGIRMGFENAFGESIKTVFVSEWDKAAQDTYKANFSDDFPIAGDITKISADEIPDFDILLAGFPCQAFSIAGQRQGFADQQGRGQLFFEIVRIMEVKRPRVAFFENVRNLERHDGGNTFRVICGELDRLGYMHTHKVMDTAKYGNTPQHRERIYIVAFRDADDFERFEWNEQVELTKHLCDILECEPKCLDNLIIDRDKPHLKTVSQFADGPIRIGSYNDKNSQGMRIYDPKGTAVTLMANGGGYGAKTGLYYIDGNIRKLSPRECARAQGFPDTYIIPERISKAYKQFGNSVSVPVIEAIAKQIKKALK